MHLKSLVGGLALMSLVGTAGADTPTAWFDTKIRDLDGWPDYTIEDIEGSWSGVEAATLKGEVEVDQYLELTDSSTALVFTADNPKALSTLVPTFTSSITFTAFDVDDKPDIPSGAKGGVIVCESVNADTGDSEYKYWGVAKSGDANAWVELAGTPDLNAAVTVAISISGNTVTYKLGDDAAQTMAIVIADDATVERTSFQGVGLVHSLSAVTVPAEKTLTIASGLAADNLKVVSVTGATKIDDTTWKFAVGADITVTFGAIKGYIWRSENTKTYAAQADSFTIDGRPDGVAKAYAADADDPIEIETYADFLKIKTEVANGNTFDGKYFKQTRDIDFASEDPWEGIGTDTYSFLGVYDGNNYELQNIIFAKNTYEGVFRYFGGTLKDLTVWMIGFDDLSETAKYGAAIVGYMRLGATLNHVIAEGELTGTHNTAGFAVQGHCGTYIGCTNRCAISVVNRDRSAGFVSFSQNGGGDMYVSSFTDCANEAAISADSGDESGESGVVGFVALMGEGHQCTFTRCVNKGALTCGNPDGYTADFVGQLGTGAGATVTIDDCVASGDYKSVGHIGAGTVTQNGGYFAQTVDDQLVYCDTPAAAGQYVVTMPNALDITLVGAQKGDQLVLDQTLAEYTGTVACDQAGLEVTQAENVWTVGLKTFKINYTYKDGDDLPLTEVENSNPTTFTIESEDITFDNTKVSKTGYTCGDGAFSPASIDCSEATADVDVVVTLTATATGKTFTITAVGCTSLMVDDVAVASPFVTAALKANDTIKIEVAYDTEIVKLPVKKITIAGGVAIDLPSNPYTYTVTGEELAQTILIKVEDASVSDDVQPKDVVPAGTDADKVESAQENITTLAQKGGKTDTTLLKSIAGWVGSKSISGNAIAVTGDEDLEAAYLLNCDDLESTTIAEAKAAFKFESITPGSKPAVTTPDGYHGTLVTKGNSSLDADGWEDLDGIEDLSPYKFFKAEITK